MPEHPKVFISYSQQDETYEQKILSFANRLRDDGIDADIDLYNPTPIEGWPRWMESRIQWADFVLLVSSKSYYDKAYQKQNGKGVSWEVNVIYNILYDQNTQTSKFIPVFFDDSDAEYILTPLKGFSYYNISTDDGYKNLCRNLIGKPKYSKPELGNIKELDTDDKLPPVEPKKQRTSMFYSTPIDLDKWNRAKWKGAVYLTQSRMVPVIGLFFENYSAAREIFS